MKAVAKWFGLMSAIAIGVLVAFVACMAVVGYGLEDAERDRNATATARAVGVLQTLAASGDWDSATPVPTSPSPDR